MVSGQSDPQEFGMGKQVMLDQQIEQLFSNL
jgi:hypothetical protein